MARSFFSQGAFLVLGRPYDTPSILYPAVLAPVFLAGDTAVSFDLARGINAALASSVVFPAYALARELCGRSPARVVAALSALVPGGVYTALIMAENLYYPLFVAAFWTAYRVLAHGRVRDAAACGLLLFLAYFAKPHVLVLACAYSASLAAWAAGARLARSRDAAAAGPESAAGGGLGPRGRLLRPGLRELAIRATPLAGLGAAFLARERIAATSAALTAGERLLGPVYARLFDLTRPWPGALELGGAAAALLLTLALATGVAPLSSALAGMAAARRERDGRWFFFLTGATVAAYLLVVARHTLQNDPHVLLNERYLYVLAPPLFTAVFALGETAGRLRCILDGLLLAGLLVLLGPLAKFALYWSAATDAPSLTGLTWLGSSTRNVWVGAAGTVVLAGTAALTVRRARRRPGTVLVALGALLVPLGAAWYAYAYGPLASRLERFTSLSRRLESRLVPGDRVTVVDRANPRARIDPRIVWHLAFWLDTPLALYASSPDGSPRGPAGPWSLTEGPFRPHASGPAGAVDDRTSPTYIVAPAGFEASCPAARPLPELHRGLPLSVTVLRIGPPGCGPGVRPARERPAPPSSAAL